MIRLTRMFPDHPEFARERKALLACVTAALSIAIVALAIQIAPKLVS